MNIDFCFEQGPTPEDRKIRRSAKSSSLAQQLIKTFMPEGGVLLELFCGTAPFAREAVKMGYHAIAVDLDEEMAVLYRAKLEKLNSEVRTLLDGVSARQPLPYSLVLLFRLQALYNGYA
jgi:predicted RNA methylase